MRRDVPKYDTGLIEAKKHQNRSGNHVVGFAILHLMFVVIGPIVGGLILLVSPFAAHDIAVILPLTVALVLFAGVAAHYAAKSLLGNR